MLVASVGESGLYVDRRHLLRWLFNPCAEVPLQVAPQPLVILPLERTVVEGEAENRVLGQGASVAFSCQRS